MAAALVVELRDRSQEGSDVCNTSGMCEDSDRKSQWKIMVER
jgi:hypothetical protein